MKNKPAVFMKQVFSIIVTATKAKSNALKSQLHIFSLLYKKKLLMSAISNKMHSAAAKEKGRTDNHGSDYSEAVMMYNAVKAESTQHHRVNEDEDDGLGDGTGSVIDLVKNSREDNSDFNLEDEINLIADVYIRRFHKMMRMQKQESFKLEE